MTKLNEEYGIKEDSRYGRCNREAAVSLILFVLAAVMAVCTIYLLTLGREPAEYGVVLGLPSYLFWGVVVTPAAFLLAVFVSLQTVFRDLSLDPVDPEYRADEKDEHQRDGGEGRGP